MEPAVPLKSDNKGPEEDGRNSLRACELFTPLNLKNFQKVGGFCFYV